MAKKQKYYVVWQGKRPGIYTSWDECNAQIKGVKDARYKAFTSRDEAEEAFNSNYRSYVGKGPKKGSLTPEELIRIGNPNYHSISVDAASSGNPGKMEYRGVDTKTGKQFFKQGPFPEGTNNIGEFLAIVHGLAFLKKKKSDRILYSDSRTAISWVRRKKCNTKLEERAENKDLFDLIRRAINWLEKNDYDTPIVKWETKAWGEIPADFWQEIIPPGKLEITCLICILKKVYLQQMISAYG